MCWQTRASSTRVWIAVALLASCSAFLGATPTETKASEQEPEECECECTAEVETVAAELVECQQQPAPEQPQKMKVITRSVEVKGPAKKCAAKGPDIKPVKSTTCAAGYLCLDETNQANLLANELAYRAWIADVRECEREQ